MARMCLWVHWDSRCCSFSLCIFLHFTELVFVRSKYNGTVRICCYHRITIQIFYHINNGNVLSSKFIMSGTYTQTHLLLLSLTFQCLCVCVLWLDSFIFHMPIACPLKSRIYHRNKLVLQVRRMSGCVDVKPFL